MKILLALYQIIRKRNEGLCTIATHSQTHPLQLDQGAQIKIYPKFSDLCTRTNQSHLAVFCIDKNTIGCYDFFQVWVLQVNRLSNSNSTSVQKTNKAMATKCNRVVTQEKRRKSIGEGREKLHFWGFQEPFTSIALYQSMYWDSKLFVFLNSYVVQRVLAFCKFNYCEFHYCDYSKKSINLLNANLCLTH